MNDLPAGLMKKRTEAGTRGALRWEIYLDEESQEGWLGDIVRWSDGTWDWHPIVPEGVTDHEPVVVDTQDEAVAEATRDAAYRAAEAAYAQQANWAAGVLAAEVAAGRFAEPWPARRIAYYTAAHQERLEAATEADAG